MKPVRETVASEEIFKITPHEDWNDGRIGFCFCRFDAMLDETGLRAEITWEDDGDLYFDGKPRTYTDPVLRLETNHWKDESWVTLNAMYIEITQAQAVEFVQSAPQVLKEKYTEHIATLRKEVISE